MATAQFFVNFLLKAIHVVIYQKEVVWLIDFLSFLQCSLLPPEKCILVHVA